MGWPQELVDVMGPFAPDKLAGSPASLGAHGVATAALLASGFVPPDLLTGMAVHLQARQPRAPRAPGTPDRASPIAGGVWVRERVTYHRPLRSDDAFVISGANVGREVKKGRRYGTTVATTVDSRGLLVVSNCTTGLLEYRADADLVDGVEGVAGDAAPGGGPDHSVVSAQPERQRLRRLSVGTTLGGAPVPVGFELMVARDGPNSDNPIHSDRDEAARSGLQAPIAGGSHVLSFVLELLMAAWGPEVLLHGAHLDVRWRRPTYADTDIVPTAMVRAVDDREVAVDLEVAGPEGPSMIGSVVIPVGEAA